MSVYIFQFAGVSCREPDQFPKADRSEFACWLCGGATVLVFGPCRGCESCETYEVRLKDPYVPHARTVRGQSWGRGYVSYLDHSGGKYLSPA